MEWENPNTNYSDFLNWVLCGDLHRFYQSVRWTGWREERSAMNGGAVYSFYPFLWTEPQLPIERRSRAVVSVVEHWSFCQNLQHQLTYLHNDWLHPYWLRHNDVSNTLDFVRTTADFRYSLTSDFQVMHDDDPLVGLWRGVIDDEWMVIVLITTRRKL